MQTNRDIARELQHKYDFYFLALVFTVLGFTIQTANCSKSYQLFLEIPSWICFAVSGFYGLSRLEWRPAIYRNYDKKFHEIKLLGQTKSKPTLQSSQPDLVSKLESNIAQRDKLEDELVGEDRTKYSIHKWLFMIGIVFLIASRACKLLSVTNGT
jgi:hypothetical protein